MSRSARSVLFFGLLCLVASCGGSNSSPMAMQPRMLYVLSPSPDGVANHKAPLLRWTPVAGAQRYSVALFKDAAQTQLIAQDEGREEASFQAPILPDHTAVYVRVRAHDSQGQVLAATRSRFRMELAPDWMPDFQLVQRDPERSQGGYKLFNLLDLHPQPPIQPVPSVVIVNAAGELVWWRILEGSGDLQAPLMLDNGHLLYIHRQVSPEFVVTSVAEEQDPSGKVIWQSPAGLLVHHDVGLGPLESRMLLVWEFLKRGDVSYEGDGIRLVDPTTNQVLWSWSLFDHFDPLVQKTKGAERIGRSFLGQDWSHANAVVWDKPRSMFWMSVRHFDSLIGIDFPSGKVRTILGRLGKIGPDLMRHQHAPEVQEDGSILLFDNGNTRSPELSRVVHFAFDENKQVANTLFEWRGEKPFFDPAVGDANRLPNGQLLITLGVSGRIIELDKAGKVVWDLRIPQGIRPRWAYRTQQLTEQQIPPSARPFRD